MATKAERFKAAQQRKGPKRAPSKKKAKKATTDVDTSDPGVSASDKKVGGKSTAKRNVSKRAAKKARAVLEDSETGTPSRKSTRKSATRTKGASKMEQQATRKTTSPSARARRAQVRARGAKRA